MRVSELLDPSQRVHRFTVLGLNEPGVRPAGHPRLGRLVVGTKGTGSSPDFNVAREPERGLPLCPFAASLLVPRVMRVWQGIVRACAPLPGEVG
jgi:hypothetical protein